MGFSVLAVVASTFLLAGFVKGVMVSACRLSRWACSRS
jgi:hypothetical protein